MKLNIYAIKDTKVGFYNPWYQHNDESAKRAFGTVMKQEDLLKETPGDFELWRVGEWDDTTGCISGYLSGPEFVASGMEFTEGGK